MSSITEDARALNELKTEKSEATAQVKDLTGLVQRAEIALKERMESEGHDGIKTDDLNFVPAETTFGQIQDRAEFVAWAQANDPELIEQRERKELLNAKVRQCLDDGEPLPPGIGFYVKEYISVRAG